MQQQQRTPKVPVWSAGAAFSAPFECPLGGVDVTASAFASPKAEPTLSAPVPRLNLAELMTARPGAGDSARSVWGGDLGQLMEADDEDDDGETHPESTATSSSKKTKSSAFKANASNNNNNNSAKLHQETLSFLEKLDLKALLHTPRPDVLDFYPSTSSLGGVAAPAAVGPNQIPNKCEDPRIEHGRDPSSAAAAHGGLHKSKQPKKDAAELSSRLSHMESTYGTTKHEPRKTRKETLERLANPILGYTSTLQALSPDVRRKREVAIDEAWNSSVSPARSTKQPKRKAAPKERSRVDHFAGSASVYEAAAASSFKKVLQKCARQPESTVTQGNNQLDDERENATMGKIRSAREKRSAGPRSIDARKAALKKKIEAKQPERSSQSAEMVSYQTPAAVGSTFLTQHEGDEEKLEARVKRAQFARPALPLQMAKPSPHAAPRQPRRPASVRPAKPDTTRAESTTTGVERAAKTERKTRPGYTSDTASAANKSKGAAETPSRELQQPRRPSGNRSQPRKPSNQDGAPSRRRPSAKAAASNGSASTKKASQVATPPTPTRKLSSGSKSSTSAMLLMGTAAPSANSSSKTSRRGNSNGKQGGVTVPPKASAREGGRSPKNAPAASLSGSGTPIAKAVERKKRMPKDAATPDRAAVKAPVALPSIRPPPKEKTDSARRNFVYRRAKAS